MAEQPLAPVPPPGRRWLSTAGFVAVLAGVLGVFMWLSQQDPPPNMPKGAPHKLSFTNAGELVGLEGEAGVAEMLSGQVKMDKELIKANVDRVNQTCMSCHGSATEVAPNDHPCRTTVTSLGVAGICVPEIKHPPKNECIKCHRMPPP